jgi:hypothetical protein
MNGGIYGTGLSGFFQCLLYVSWLLVFPAWSAPTQLVDEAPVSIVMVEDGTVLVDFGRVAFGNLRLISPEDAKVTVHFGEAMKAGRVDRKPPGTVRYNSATATLAGNTSLVVAPAKDKRNTNYDHKPPAIRLPEEWGVILPFRWVEIVGWKGELKPEQVVRQSAYASTWNDDAASFECSDEMLNRIWELCHYSIKATTFAGVYVDGDRERIPYEADSYLNQLSHYYSDPDKRMARDTIDYLMIYRTWPSEWPPHLVFMVHADWMHTGDTTMVEKHYEALKSKILTERKGDDGLIATTQQQIKKGDIVDWPKDERDGYVFTSRNTVVNAFHLRALERMAEMARVLGKEEEAASFEADYHKTLAAFQQAFFQAETGLYKDGVDTDHHSLHANLFPLAFGLVPKEARVGVAEWVAERGMACSVYAAQYLLEALFENGMDEQAVALMSADNDRSWRHMVESGTTITWEAWDQKYKPNQDWNHAWGAAPANLLPRYILGVEPLAPGWKTARIRPRLAGLTSAQGTVPTPYGALDVQWQQADALFTLSVTVPKGMTAYIEIPEAMPRVQIFCNGTLQPVRRSGNCWVAVFKSL